MRSTALLALITLAGCSVSHAVRPLPAGTGAVTASMGGPISGDLPLPIAFAVPITTVGYAHGVSDTTTVHGAAHLVGLAAFGIVGADIGVAHQLFDADGPRPRLMLDGDLILLAGDNTPGVDPPFGFRALPDLQLVTSWDLGPHAVYVGLDQLVQPAPSFRYHPTPLLGAMLTAGRVDVQLEYKWMGWYIDNEPLTAVWYGPFHHGATSIQVGLKVRLGQGGAE